MPKQNFHASRPLKNAKNLKFGIKNANIPTLIMAKHTSFHCALQRALRYKQKGNANKGLHRPSGTIFKKLVILGHLRTFAQWTETNNNFDMLIHESLIILRDRPIRNQQNSFIPLYLF